MSDLTPTEAEEALANGDEEDVAEALEVEREAAEAAPEEAAVSSDTVADLVEEEAELAAVVEEAVIEEIVEEAVLEAIEEHGAMKDLMRKISRAPRGDESLKAKVQVLCEIVSHHVKEEETTFFPEVKRLLGEDRLEKLGTEIVRLKARSKRAMPKANKKQTHAKQTNPKQTNPHDLAAVEAGLEAPRVAIFYVETIANPACGGCGAVADSSTSTSRGAALAMRTCSPASGSWRFHPRTRTYGFAPIRTGTCRRPVGTRAGENSIGITPNGARCAMRRNSNTSSNSRARFPQSARGSTPTCRWGDCASVVRLLESTRARVGNVEYARTNGSYGLTTLRNRHVEIDRATLRFRFRGKSGVEHVVSIADRRLARVIERCRDLPGQELFAYVDDEGAVVPIHSDDVNEYLRGVSGADVTAKDFRTWSATTLCAVVLEALPPARTERHRKEAIVRTIAQVAAQLGNTAAVCRKCYVHPALIEAFLDDGYIRLPRRRGARGASNGLEAAAVAAEKRRNRGRRTERVADEHSVQSQRHVDRRARRKRPLVGRNPRPSTRASARARRPRR